jgi:putative ABC transport system permease protein
LRLFALAVRNLGRHRRRTALSILVLALGVLSLVTMRAMMNGIQAVNRSMFIDATYGALQVHKAGYFELLDASPLSMDFDDTAELRGKILAVPGVRALSPRIHFAAMLSLPDEGETPGAVTHLLLTAVDPPLEREALRRRSEWVTAWPASAAERELVIDRQLAAGIGLSEATRDGVPEAQWPAVLAPDKDDALNGIALRVRGHLGSGLPGDRRVGLVTLGAAQELLRMPGRVTEYALAVEDQDALEETRARVQAAVGPGYEVHRWDDLIPILNELQRGQDVFSMVLSLIVIGVVLLVVANALLMTVMDRVREIGTLLAIGMRRRAVVGLFVTEAAVLGASAGTLGIAAGVVAVRAMDAAELRLPAPGAELAQRVGFFISWQWLAVFFGLAIFGAIGAALWAARALARLSPVEALREP